MEPLFTYLLKSSGLIALFYVCYKILLSKETFFTHNRHFMLAGALVAFIMPFYYLTKTIVVEPLTMNFSTSESNILQTSTTITEAFDWWQLLTVLYGLGFLFFLGRFSIQLLSLNKLLKSGTHIKKDGFTIVETNNDTSPFSFFNYIVYNPKVHTVDALQTIITHEKVHAKQKHSLDMLLMHIACILQWFNPFAWWYKKIAAQNLEYIADDALTQNLACKKEYQYLLLNQSKHTRQQLTIINPFFNSLIKKRIVMINQQKSKSVKTFKYALVVPFLAMFLLFFNTKTVAQTTTENETVITSTKSALLINKNSSNERLEKLEKIIKKRDNIDLSFYDIKRNSKNEIISIKSEWEKNSSSGNWKIKGNKPIKPFNFFIAYDKDNKTSDIGYAYVKESDIKTTNTNSEITNVSFKNTEETTDVSVKIHDVKIDGDKADSYIDIAHFSETAGKSAIVIVDGINKGTNYEAIKIKYSELEEMNLEQASEKTLTKYGPEGKNGVIEIKTKKK